MSRKIARAIAFKIIYQLEFQKQDYDFIYDKTIEEENVSNPSIIEYIEKVTKGVTNHNSEIEKRIEDSLKIGWGLSRISKINIAILKIAIFELVYLNNEIPVKVAINEALELVNTYGEPNDKSFVNGILAKILKENSEGK